MTRLIHRTTFFILAFFISTCSWSQSKAVNLNQINSVSGVIEILKESALDTNCSIKGFSLMVYPKKGDVYRVESTGKKAAAELKKIVENLQTGDVLVFQNVLMQCNNQPASLVADRKLVVR